ncbi:phosphatase PAP2 family protein [Cellulomonas gilvus]|uniref:Inositolphosphotransferase Aur1/Ipt1 domain-containing protein n=1 Tax=Cellulomonas gilvus (strain ATCC 13127 / NRRL B-14078) TaxID=593907 RepID=F8A4D2_CELGA|nr:phosphatase PAP2 family protein [Cellulomonas gilvus]AEI12038.1 hypothetical protein Celgi_1519 [Cellulomonas gilvus ATCC 13127]
MSQDQARAGGRGAPSSSVDLAGDARRSRRRRVLREVLLVVALYAGYSATRLAATGAWEPAARHAAWIVDVERWMGLDVERSWNLWLAHHGWLEVAVSYWYQSMHYLVTPTVLVVLFIRRPLVYAPARTALMSATFLALFGYFFVPTAPPRLLPGYVDTVSEASVHGWWPSVAEQAANGASSVTNQVAAMPSMHVGWALWVSLVLATVARGRLLKVLSFGYVGLTTVVVVVTANHWVLDAVAGAALVLVTWFVSFRRYGWWASRKAERAELGALTPVPDVPVEAAPPVALTHAVDAAAVRRAGGDDTAPA